MNINEINNRQMNIFSSLNKNIISNMQNICPKCYNTPLSHSFRLLNTSLNIPVFYTDAGEAKDYSDSDGILSHYENMLKMYGNKEWIWVFNCDNLELKHSLELNTSRRIAKLIAEKYYNIKKIYVLKPNFIFNIILNIVYPFLDDKIKDLIITTDKLQFEVYV